MNESVFEQIHEAAKFLGLDLEAWEIARLTTEFGMNEESIEAAAKIFQYLMQKKSETIVTTLLRMSRLPLKEAKTFENFDFSLYRGKQYEELKNIPSLSAVYAHRNMAFIGPQGIVKTHLAMAIGRECCKRGLKTYFLKATELNQKLTDARKYGTKRPR